VTLFSLKFNTELVFEKNNVVFNVWPGSGSGSASDRHSFSNPHKVDAGSETLVLSLGADKD
jgi:hypothetical protein